MGAPGLCEAPEATGSLVPPQPCRTDKTTDTLSKSRGKAGQSSGLWEGAMHPAASSLLPELCQARLGVRKTKNELHREERLPVSPGADAAPVGTGSCHTAAPHVVAEDWPPEEDTRAQRHGSRWSSCKGVDPGLDTMGPRPTPSNDMERALPSTLPHR